MASFPGWYLTDVAQIVYLPEIEGHEADLGQEIGDEYLETDGGKGYAYNQFEREIMHLTWPSVNAAGLAALRAMHDAVGGRALPFYYKDSDGVTTYVRKEDPNFIYRRLPSYPDRFEVKMNLRQEPTDAEIDA